MSYKYGRVWFCNRVNKWKANYPDGAAVRSGDDDVSCFKTKREAEGCLKSCYEEEEKFAACLNKKEPSITWESIAKFLKENLRLDFSRNSYSDDVYYKLSINDEEICGGIIDIKDKYESNDY